MSAPSTPTPLQSAPQVTPPTSSPDAGISGTGASAEQRRKAMSMAGMANNIATSPLGAITQALTTASKTSGLLG